MSHWRPTVARVDLGAIRHNTRALSALLGPGTDHLQVVKANGYGHGDVQVAQACLEAGVGRLGVALVEEGVRLREAGIGAPILLLIEADPSAAEQILANDLTPSVSTRAGAEAVAAAASAAGVRHPVHVTVDTGMHREGSPAEQVLDLVRWISGHRSLDLEGLWSHLATPDEVRNPATDRQIAAFSKIAGRVEAAGVEVPLRHLANSAATIARPESHHDMVRCGIACYGLYPAAWMTSMVDLRPALSLHSSVGLVRRVPAGEGVSYGLTWAPDTDTTVATVQIGYGDGFSRLLSNRAHVLIGGSRRRVVGRVTMDTIMVDCGDDEVGPGDEVVLIGRQGGEEVSAGELADLIGTIHYEVVCALSARVPRIHEG